MFEKFSKELPEFLWDLRFNNNKPWFDEHRDLYKKCLQIPFKELANEVYNYMNVRIPRMFSICMFRESTEICAVRRRSVRIRTICGFRYITPMPTNTTDRRFISAFPPMAGASGAVYSKLLRRLC